MDGVWGTSLKCLRVVVYEGGALQLLRAEWTVTVTCEGPQHPRRVPTLPELLNR